MLAENIDHDEIRFRSAVALWIGGLVLLLNAAVFYLIDAAFSADRALALAPADRVVTPGVLSALVGATALQVGMAVIALRRYRVWRSEHAG
ncbi:MAG: hypothetical protein M0037_00125 [Betaproteobacteria bacterium]|nr:hypothetical protein [Betaproteobacteria bacterium]